MTRLRIGASHKSAAGTALADLDGRPKTGETDRLLAALIEQHGPDGRPDIYGDGSGVELPYRQIVDGPNKQADWVMLDASN